MRLRTAFLFEFVWNKLYLIRLGNDIIFAENLWAIKFTFNLLQNLSENVILLINMFSLD